MPEEVAYFDKFGEVSMWDHTRFIDFFFIGMLIFCPWHHYIIWFFFIIILFFAEQNLEISLLSPNCDFPTQVKVSWRWLEALPGDELEFWSILWQTNNSTFIAKLLILLFRVPLWSGKINVCEKYLIILQSISNLLTITSTPFHCVDRINI